MYLVKRSDGAYIPYDSSDYEASKKIPIGETIKATQARNYKFLKKAMSLLKLGFDNQEKYQEFELFRKIITIKAGFCYEVESKRGIEYIPMSLSYDKMNEEEFEKFYKSALNVISNDLQTAPREIQAAAEGYY